jgi:hypothetical protein
MFFAEPVFIFITPGPNAGFGRIPQHNLIPVLTLLFCKFIPMKKCFAIISVLVFLSCKKEKPIVTETTPVPDSPYAVSTATAYNGIFICNENDIMAGFSSTAFPDLYSDTAQVKRVTCNSLALHYIQDNLFYSGNTYNAGSIALSIEGAGGIPSFNYTYSDLTPSYYLHSTIIPGTISKSTGFTIQINGVKDVVPTGMDVVFKSLKGPPNVIYKPISNGDNTITFTPAELASFPTSTDYYSYEILITLENSKVLNFYGKDFKFARQKFVPGYVKVIN